MSDGIAPAVDKVGAPEPTAPEAQAGAPTMDTTTAAAAPEKLAVSKPAEEVKEPAQEKAPEVAKSILKVPKPVEVMSVPETPVNGATPVGGTPRIELNILPEPDDVEKPQREPVVMTGVQEPLPTPATSIPNSDVGIDAIADKPLTTNGHSKAPEATDEAQADEAATKEKRKLEDAKAAVADEAPVNEPENDESERADKKAKIDTDTDTADSKSNGGVPARGRPGRPKKDKTAPPPVGKTARKTRSQGPVEV